MSEVDQNIGSLEAIRKEIEANTPGAAPVAPVQPNEQPAPAAHVAVPEPVRPVIQPEFPVEAEVPTKVESVAAAMSDTSVVLQANENMQIADEARNAELVDPAPVDEDEASEEDVVENSSLVGITLGKVSEELEDENREEHVNFLNKPNEVRASTGGAKAIRDTIRKAADSANSESVKINKNTSPLDLTENLAFLQKINPVHTYPIVAMKSGYRAFMRPMSNNDKLVVRQLWTSPISAVDRFLKMVRLVHSQIESNSYTSRLSYAQFIRDTAEDDLQTLIFGIYAGTFPDATEYTLQCPHCGENMKVRVTPNNLLEVVDMQKAGKYIYDLINNIDKGQEFVDRSLVKVRKEITAPDTKIVFRLRTPSIEDSINNMRLVERLKDSSYTEDLIANIRYIDSILVPNYAILEKTGELEYQEVNSVEEILNIFDKYLSSADADFVLKAIIDYSEEYKVNYRIGKVTCPNSKCGQDIKRVDVDVASLLFLGSVGGKVPA